MVGFVSDGLTVTVTVTSTTRVPQQPSGGSSPHPAGHLPFTGAPLAALLVLAALCVAFGAVLHRVGKLTNGIR
jgi:hypothetical protein